MNSFPNSVLESAQFHLHLVVEEVAALCVSTKLLAVISRLDILVDVCAFLIQQTEARIDRVGPDAAFVLALSARNKSGEVGELLDLVLIPGLPFLDITDRVALLILKTVPVQLVTEEEGELARGATGRALQGRRAGTELHLVGSRLLFLH